MSVSDVVYEFSQVGPHPNRHAIDFVRGADERQTALTVNMSKADSQYIDDALTIEDEYESDLAAVQVALTRYEVAPHEYAARRAEIATRAYLRLADAHKRFLNRNN
jgi:hypothetical protein